MSHNDQTLVDYLYNTLSTQKLRCDYFNLTGEQAHNSIWNRYSDEKKILDKMVDQYKKYYSDKVEEMKIDITTIKNHNINSYMTFDPEYHINQYNERMEEINKYLVELEMKNVNHIIVDKISSVSKSIDTEYPNYFANPSLLGKM